jgi:hypothetical protein
VNNPLRSALLLAAFASLAACGSDTPSGPVANFGPLTAMVGNASFNGFAFEAPTFVAGKLNIVAIKDFGTVTASQIDIEIVPITGTGTFTFGVGSTHTANYAASDGTAISLWSTDQLGGGGTVTITELNGTRVVGTFAFNMGPRAGTPATGVIQVTQGSFNVRFTP